VTDWRPHCDLDALHARATLLSDLREFFRERGVLEVQTAVLAEHTVTDVNIESLPAGAAGYLQTSPEYQLKRLLAAGAPSLYQIGPVFRAGEVGRLHNPEFTLLEWYRLGFDDDTNNISFTTPGFDAGILVKLSSKGTSHLLFSYGRLPYPIAQNTNFFLERQRPGGTIYRWSDSNGDGLYQAGEEGTVYGYTGGNTHYVSEDISAPVNERLMLHFSTKISKNFVLNIKGIYKKIRNNLRVRFQQEYGMYETHGQYDLYFFDQPFQDYYLGSGGYEKDPFYAGLHFNFKGRRADRWFFSFSFLAHMGMGATAFGNGPASNDFRILDESQANPNSLLNSFGRVDAERGFVAKSYFGYYLAKRLFLAVSLKYRDGNPFAFLESVSAHDQRVIYYSTIKGEDEKGKKGGPREDYLADVSVQLNYSFKLFNGDAKLKLSFLNLLDFGAELSEYVYSGGLRDAVEMQIPRSARLTFEWQF